MMLTLILDKPWDKEVLQGLNNSSKWSVISKKMKRGATNILCLKDSLRCGNLRYIYINIEKLVLAL